MNHDNVTIIMFKNIDISSKPKIIINIILVNHVLYELLSSNSPQKFEIWKKLSTEIKPLDLHDFQPFSRHKN